jgi:acyl-CoA synthetase (AMP-forming)/AMP-acid ligase II
MILIDHFEETARTTPEREFLYFAAPDPGDDAVMSYAEADRRASATARQLRARGISRGDVVALMLPNGPDWLIWYLACQKIGAITCGLNSQLLVPELVANVDDVEARVIVATPGTMAKARDVAQGCRHEPEIAKPTKYHGDEPLARDPALGESDTVSVIFTSGTTGVRPKALTVPHSALVHGMAWYLRELGYRSDDRIMIVTPLFHGAALNWAVSMALIAGATLVVTEHFSASRFWDQAERSRATVLWTLAAIPFILLTLPPSDAERRALMHLRNLFAAGAGIRWREITDRFGPIFLDGFGMSETPGTLTGPDSFDHDEPFPCVGRPVPGVDLRIVDPETGETCPPRTTGEIVVRYGQGFSGYLNNPEAFTEAVRDGWFHTGDLAYCDETGRIFFVDRIKDIIRRGSENLSAREIEQAMIAHPEVAEAYAVAGPHPILGEIVCAFLVPREAGRVFGLDEIRAFCAGRLATIKLPEEVRTVASESLPRTPTGRVKKFRLKEQLRAEAAASAS